MLESGPCASSLSAALWAADAAEQVVREMPVSGGRKPLTAEASVELADEDEQLRELVTVRDDVPILLELEDRHVLASTGFVGMLDVKRIEVKNVNLTKVVSTFNSAPRILYRFSDAF